MSQSSIFHTFMERESRSLSHTHRFRSGGRSGPVQNPTWLWIFHPNNDPQSHLLGSGRILTLFLSLVLGRQFLLQFSDSNIIFKNI